MDADGVIIGVAGAAGMEPAVPGREREVCALTELRRLEEEIASNDSLRFKVCVGCSGIVSPIVLRDAGVSGRA